MKLNLLPRLKKYNEQLGALAHGIVKTQSLCRAALACIILTSTPSFADNAVGFENPTTVDLKEGDAVSMEHFNNQTAINFPCNNIPPQVQEYGNCTTTISTNPATCETEITQRCETPISCVYQHPRLCPKQDIFITYNSGSPTHVVMATTYKEPTGNNNNISTARPGNRNITTVTEQASIGSNGQITNASIDINIDTTR